MSLFSSLLHKVNPAAWVGGAVGGVPGFVAGQVLGGKKKAPTSPADVGPYSQQGLLNTENQQMTSALGRGDSALNSYEDFAKNFDASKGLNQFAQGAWGSISDALNESLGHEQASAVGRGRLGTGFYDQDRGTIYNRATKQLADAVSQQALNAQGQQIGVMQNYGNYGMAEQGTGLDLLTGRREEVENDAREEAERKRKKSSGIGGLIGGALGGVGGFLLGGPTGAMTGWELGSAAGRSVS